MNLFSFFKKKEDKKTQRVLNIFYSKDKDGYDKLYKEDFELFSLSKNFFMDYNLNWADLEKKKFVMNYVCVYVGVPFFNAVKDRNVKRHKREMKRYLRNVDQNDENIGIVEIANILLNFKK